MHAPRALTVWTGNIQNCVGSGLDIGVIATAKATVKATVEARAKAMGKAEGFNMHNGSPEIGHDSIDFLQTHTRGD